MSDVKLFLEDMFEYFREITKDGSYDDFKVLSYEKIIHTDSPHF